MPDVKNARKLYHYQDIRMTCLGRRVEMVCRHMDLRGLPPLVLASLRFASGAIFRHRTINLPALTCILARPLSGR